MRNVEWKGRAGILQQRFYSDDRTNHVRVNVTSCKVLVFRSFLKRYFSFGFEWDRKRHCAFTEISSVFTTSWLLITALFIVLDFYSRFSVLDSILLISLSGKKKRIRRDLISKTTNVLVYQNTMTSLSKSCRITKVHRKDDCAERSKILLLQIQIWK